MHGAMNLKTIYELYQKEIEANPPKSNKKKRKQKEKRSQQVGSLIADTQISKVQSHYPADYESTPTSISTKNADEEAEDTIQKSQALQPVEMKSIESNLNEMAIDENRIIHPNAGLSGLYEFVPATQIKGNRCCIPIIPYI